MSKIKILRCKLKQALMYNNSHFNLIKDDHKTALNRSDLQYLINLLENGK